MFIEELEFNLSNVREEIDTFIVKTFVSDRNSRFANQPIPES